MYVAKYNIFLQAISTSLSLACVFVYLSLTLVKSGVLKTNRPLSRFIVQTWDVYTGIRNKTEDFRVSNKSAFFPETTFSNPLFTYRKF